MTSSLKAMSFGTRHVAVAYLEADGVVGCLFVGIFHAEVNIVGASRHCDCCNC